MTYFNSDPKPEKKVKPPYQGLKRMGIKRTFPKKTGEAELFLEIWNERPHVSQISGEPLGDEAHTYMFMHILSKKNYSRLRLDKNNIWLGTFDEHYILDHGTMADIERHPAREGFMKLLAKREEMKIEYNAPKPTV